MKLSLSVGHPPSRARPQGTVRIRSDIPNLGPHERQSGEGVGRPLSLSMGGIGRGLVCHKSHVLLAFAPSCRTHGGGGGGSAKTSFPSAVATLCEGCYGRGRVS